MFGQAEVVVSEQVVAEAAFGQAEVVVSEQVVAEAALVVDRTAVEVVAAQAQPRLLATRPE